LPAGNREFLVETGGFIHSAEEVGSVVIGVTGDKPVYLRDVSHIEDGAEEPADYVLYGTGPAYHQQTDVNSQAAQTALPAVTISIAKRKGTNAITVADHVIEKGRKTERIANPQRRERRRHAQLR
jgi:multidrug efflux pump subunit AcrB